MMTPIQQILLSLSLLATACSSLKTDLSSYHPHAQLVALQISHLPSPNILEPDISLTEVYLHIYCPSHPPRIPQSNQLNLPNRVQDTKCLALRGDSCSGTQSQVYYHLWHNVKLLTSAEVLYGADPDSDEVQTAAEVPVDELPGHAAILEGKRVVLADGEAERGLRKRFKIQDGGLTTAAEAERVASETEKRLRGMSLLQWFLEGEDMNGLLRACWWRQKRRMRVKNRRLLSRIQYVRKRVNANKEAMRMWQEGQLGEVVQRWLKHMRERSWVWELGVCAALQWIVVRLGGTFGRRSWKHCTANMERITKTGVWGKVGRALEI